MNRIRIRLTSFVLFAALGLTACKRQAKDGLIVASVSGSAGDFVGFDRNTYPGDDRLAELHRSFSFVGFWLTDPPLAGSNSWLGKRAVVRAAGFGFLVLANGKIDREIKDSDDDPEVLGRKDGIAAIAAARREGFPDATIIFLDQEEGGRLLPEQAAYFFGWTEAVAASPYKPGAYLSGQSAPDGTGPDGKPLTVTTAQDVREQIAAKHLHPVTLWVAQDTCGPSTGCTLKPPHIRDSGTMDAAVWQYAQSPRRPELTRSCAKTYAPDDNCYAGVTKDLSLDLDVATSADPSHGR